MNGMRLMRSPTNMAAPQIAAVNIIAAGTRLISGTCHYKSPPISLGINFLYTSP